MDRPAFVLVRVLARPFGEPLAKFGQSGGVEVLGELLDAELIELAWRR